MKLQAAFAGGSFPHATMRAGPGILRRGGEHEAFGRVQLPCGPPMRREACGETRRGIESVKHLPLWVGAGWSTDRLKKEDFRCSVCGRVGACLAAVGH